MPRESLKGTYFSLAKRSYLRGWLRKTFLVEKLNNVAGLVLLIVCALMISFIVSKGVKPGIMFMAVLLVLPVVYGIFAYAKVGITFYIITSYFLFTLIRLGTGAPVGTLLDGFLGILLVTIIARQKKENNWAIFKSPVSSVILIWFGYNIIEVANPSQPVIDQWLYTVRSVAFTWLSFFAFLYYIRDIKFIRFLLVLYLGLGVIGALYGLKQEFLGFSSAEWEFLNSNPEVQSLLLIAGHWRKFSIFSDPVAFAYNMSMAVILCITIVAGRFAFWMKIVCFALIILYFVSGIFSGTRGANVLVPAALFLFAILNFNRRVLIFSVFVALFFAFLITVPTSNQNLIRFQTAFNPSHDDSYNLRKFNQKRIQPYILKHPMGGGLGSTGTWGERFAPNSFLAHFAPDSGYIRVAVEEGWIGLFVFCVMMYTIMKTGIDNFFDIKDPELRTYCLASLLIVFAYNIANFPQEALVQYPSNILFNLFAALIVITKRLDEEKTKAQINKMVQEENLIAA